MSSRVKQSGLLLLSLGWVILMGWVCQDVMRESDQASLLEGAIILSKKGLTGEVPLFHNYSGQYGSYWLLAGAYWLWSFDHLGEWVSFGNALACYPFVAVVLILAWLRRAQLGIYWLIGLSTPCLILSVPLLASNVLAGTLLLVFVGLNAYWDRWWGTLSASMACFGAVCLRQDVVLLLPLACLLAARQKEIRSLLRTGPYYFFGLAAVAALGLGNALSGAERYLPAPIFDLRLVSAYLVFGLGGTSLALLAFALNRGSQSRWFAWMVRLALLLPLAFYLPMLYSPRHLFVVALIPFIVTLSPGAFKTTKGQKALLAVALAGNVCWLCLGGVVSKQEGRSELSLHLTKALWYPTADGLWPTGAGFGFLQELRGATEAPLDHNQEVWKAWVTLPPSAGPLIKGAVAKGPLRAYQHLWTAFYGLGPDKQGSSQQELADQDGSQMLLTDREFFGTGGRSQHDLTQTVGLMGTQDPSSPASFEVIHAAGGRLLYRSTSSREIAPRPLSHRLREDLAQRAPGIDFSLREVQSFSQGRRGHLVFFYQIEGNEGQRDPGVTFDPRKRYFMAESIYPELLIEVFLK